MNFSLPVYIRPLPGGREEWTTVGLGEDTCTRQGRSEAKIRHSLQSELQRLVREMSPKGLERLQARPGLRLERVRLELTLRSADGGKRKATGLFPLLLEPRWLGARARAALAYHPLRPAEWFPVDEGDEEGLEQRASLYFQKVWASLAEADLLSLQTGDRDRLRMIAFSAEPRSLLDQLPDRARGIWDDLRPQRVKPGQGQRKGGGLKVLPELGVDLTQRAAELGLPLGVPRSPYRERLQVLLCGEQPRSVLVVGPPRVGKTNLLYLAVPDLLECDGWSTHQNLEKVRHVWAISGQRLLAGMSFLGDWEQRCLDLLEDAQRKSVLLLVDDLPAFGRLGRSRESDRNFAELFRGPLARGELCMIGECTAEQLQRLEDEAPAFATLFSRLPVAETGPGETLRLLLREARSLETAHGLAFSPQLWRPLLELGGSLLSGAAFPGKALDLLHELQRAARRRPAPAAAEGAKPPAREVGPEDLLGLLAQKTGLPATLLKLEEPLDAAELRAAFERQIMGQPDAVAAACALVLRIRAGLCDARRPYGVYLFTGPTGTGKTELCKCIAEYLYGAASRLLRFDMGEHSDPWAAARLVGDAERPEGTLSAPIREQPFCVLLLDEIEKAHPAVLQLMLQIFDEGRLTDAAGNLCDFTHAVIIMTSNLGARPQSPAGFADQGEEQQQECLRAVREFFAPELFNRIDQVILFRSLDRKTAERVAGKELASLLGRRGLSDRNIFVYPSARLLERVVSEGFDERYGARPLKRYLEREVGSLLAEHLAGAPSALMQVLRLYLDPGGAVTLHAERLVEAEPEPAELPMEGLLRLGMRELQERLPAALDYLDELLASDALMGLRDEISRRLASRASGEAGHEDALYNLEVMRGELRALRGRIGFLHASPRPDRQRILRQLAEVQFLRRSLEQVHDPGRHAVLLELLHLGLARRKPRFREPGASLLSLLARAYLGERVSLEGFALRGESGRVMHGGPGDEPPLGPADEPPVHLVLKLAGLNVLDFFAGETGCQVWRSLGRGADVVRVRVWGAAEQQPEQIVAEHLAGVRELELALEEGRQPLPENPQLLLPLVREFRFDPPAQARREAAPLEVTDFALGYAASMQVCSLEEALPRLWLLRMGRREAEEDQP
jgi:ATP-dependent Clp protease ATP-binding subunit ClpC